MKTTQNAVTAAVKLLRISLGDTQQEFATRTKLAISTVVRHELYQPPRGRTLIALKKLAEKHGLSDIARVFSYALGQSVTPETSALHAAITTLWWNRRSLSGWPELASHLVSRLEALLDIKRRDPLGTPGSVQELEAQLTQLRSTVSGTALDEISAATSKILEGSKDLTWEQAYTEALKRNPDLYAKYLAERATAAEGTKFEQSLSVSSGRQRKRK